MRPYVCRVSHLISCVHYVSLEGSVQPGRTLPSSASLGCSGASLDLDGRHSISPKTPITEPIFSSQMEKAMV